MLKNKMLNHKETWLKRIQNIPIIQQAGLLDWQIIASGSSNQNFKVTTKQGIWVLRFNQAALGINRQQEQRILTMIEPLKIMPKVIEISVIENNSDQGHLITEFEPQGKWQNENFNNPQYLNTLQQTLTVFHQLPYQYLPSRLDHRIRNYLKSIPAVPTELQITLSQSIDQLTSLGFWQANNTLYHSDLNPSNVLGKNPISIIDWEYAGQGHPLLDWLIMEYHSSVDLTDYYPLDLRDEWIRPAKTMIDGMMKLWDIHTI